jgi:TUP1-like enhancer of split
MSADCCSAIKRGARSPCVGASADDAARGVQTVAQRDADARAHLESAMAAAEVLGSAADWTNWLVQYVRLLAQQGDVSRLDELCESLLGPVSGPQLTAHGRAEQGDGHAAAGVRRLACVAAA